MRPTRFLALTLTVAAAGCATAPRAVDIDQAQTDVGNRTIPAGNYVSYMLPKSIFVTSGSWERRSYTPGPLQEELKTWRSRERARCETAARLNPKSPCFWNLNFRLTPAASSIVQCIHTGEGLAQTISLVRTAQPVLSVLTAPDESQQYAIALDRQFFQQTELALEFSANGGLGSYSAKSTSLIAETVEKVLVDEILAADFQAAPEPPSFCTTYPGLCSLVNELAKLEQARSRAVSGPDPKAATELIDARILELRSLAEGVEKTTSFAFELRNEPKKDAGETNESGNLAAETPAETKPESNEARLNLLERLQCDTGGSADMELKITPIASMQAPLQKAAAIDGTKDPALYYRIPMPAVPSIEITCSGAHLKGACTKTATLKFPVAPVPQLGEVVKLPRKLGWRSGALAAKLDPNTGALLSVSASSQGSLEASVANSLYAAEVARRAAAQVAASKDSERASLERTRVLLEDQVKICNARRALGLPPGDDCPGP